MKRELLVMVCALVAIVTNGQDIIVTTNSQKIEAKILEVSKTEVKYKETDYLDGPTFILTIKDINSITYANGKVVHYNNIDEVIPKEKEAHMPIGSLVFDPQDKEDIPSKGECIGKEAIRNSSSYSIPNRDLIGKLPCPLNTYNQEGKIVVQIQVNTAGNVVSAQCVAGTTIYDPQTIQFALDAARKAKFTEGRQEEIGTIIYNFII